MATQNPLVEYIRQAAMARGIDPSVAVRVAQGEGGLSNPFRHGEGPAPKTQAPQFGSKENSFGPFQLYISGTGAGLGDKALAAGIDPRKNWQAGVDYALDTAKKDGWGQWYGAKAQGITGMMGINGNPSSVPGAPSVASATPSVSATASQGVTQTAQPVSIPDYVQKLAGGAPSGKSSDGSPLAALLGSMAPQTPQFSPVQFGGQSQQPTLAALVQALNGRTI